MLEKNTRKERRTRIVHTKNRGAGERKFRQEVVIDHAGWMKEFNRYVADSLRYPEDARLEKLQGEIQLTVRLNRNLPGSNSFNVYRLHATVRQFVW